MYTKYTCIEEKNKDTELSTWIKGKKKYVYIFEKKSTKRDREKEYRKSLSVEYSGTFSIGHSLTMINGYKMLERFEHKTKKNINLHVVVKLLPTHIIKY